MTKIKMILGSTRPGRFGPQVADWLQKLASEQPGAEFELVDLAEVNLPFLDESIPPLRHQYAGEHTKAWAKIIDDADGFVFITPEYNYSTSAALKNAIDTINAEWNYKPVAMVSYGASAGGARAVAHLRSIVGVLGMYDTREEINIQYFSQLDEKGIFVPNEGQNELARKLLKSLVFWTNELKPIREKFLAS